VPRTGLTNTHLRTVTIARAIVVPTDDASEFHPAVFKATIASRIVSGCVSGNRRIDRPLRTEQSSTNVGQWGCRAQQPSRRNQTRLGRRLRLELVGELADLGRRVAPVATKGLQER
jgi:hypothetical protein